MPVENSTKIVTAMQDHSQDHTFAPPRSIFFRQVAPALLAMGLLSGCMDKLNKVPGIGPPPKVVAKENDDKAIGGACRYANRSIEDCYVLNPKATKNHIFVGWKEMDEYMREHNIQGMPSVVAPSEPPRRRTQEEMEAEFGSGSSSGR